MSTTQIRLETKAEVDPETEQIIRQRLATFEEDKKNPKPWDEVKARILQTLKPR